MVDHSDEIPCSGKFLLHQGVQRRIAITLCHEGSPDLIWRDVKEVVIGNLNFDILEACKMRGKRMKSECCYFRQFEKPVIKTFV